MLPFLLGAWLVVLNNLDFLNNYSGVKCIIIIVLSISYIFGLIYTKKTAIEEKKLKSARDQIEARLEKRGGRRASFDAIRKEVNEEYNNDFLNNLIDKYPKKFGKCTIKKGEKKGITLIPKKSEDT